MNTFYGKYLYPLIIKRSNKFHLLALVTALLVSTIISIQPKNNIRLNVENLNFSEHIIIVGNFNANPEFKLNSNTFFK